MSDSIVLASKKNTKGLERLMFACQKIQTTFLIRNLYLRGAISFGELHFDRQNNLMIGMGLVNAYLLEREAINPRILIDPKILFDLSMTLSEFMREFKYTKDNDAVKLIHHLHADGDSEKLDDLFVDYLERIINTYITDPFSTSLEKIYENIYKNLYSSQTVYPKYLWLKKYIILSLKDYKYRNQFLSTSTTSPKHVDRLENILAKFTKM